MEEEEGKTGRKIFLYPSQSGVWMLSGPLPLTQCPAVMPLCSV